MIYAKNVDIKRVHSIHLDWYIIAYFNVCKCKDTESRKYFLVEVNDRFTYCGTYMRRVVRFSPLL